MSEPVAKRQRSDMWGKNPMGIVVAKPWTPADAECNICKQRVYAEQRIMLDEKYGYGPQRWWNHLECAPLDLFTEDEHDQCTTASTATDDGKDRQPRCAWCANDIIIGQQQWHAYWMGWTHAHCNVGEMSDFVDILQILQQKYPGKSMPKWMHWWKELKQLKTWAGMLDSATPQIKSDPNPTQALPCANALISIKLDPEVEDLTSDSDSQATEIYEPVLGPAIPLQPVRASVGR